MASARQRLTKALIENAIAAGTGGRAAVVLRDDKAPGLGLRIRKNGGASWVYIFRPKNARRDDPPQTLTLGAWPALSIKEAQDTAAQHAAARAAGNNPAAELKAARMRERNELQTVLTAYEEDLERRGLVKRKTAMSALNAAFAKFKSKRVEVDTITTQQAVGLIDALEKAGKPGAAADLRKHLKGLFNFCVRKGYAPHNPLAGLVRPRKTRLQILSTVEKGRALGDDEIVRIWAASRDMGSFGALVRLGLLTGMRRGELAGLHWKNIKADRIVVDAHVAKTARKHEIPLTPAMRAALPPRGSSSIVFPSSRRSDPTPLSGWTQMLKVLRDKAGFGPAKKGAKADDAFSMHDLRRTCRTLMSKTGVVEDVAELAIGHVKRSLIAKYDKDDAWPLRVDAFERVSNHISKLVADGGDNVVALQSPAPSKPSAVLKERGK